MSARAGVLAAALSLAAAQLVLLGTPATATATAMSSVGPAVRGGGDVATAPLPAEKPKPIEGGDKASTAPELTTGRYTDTISKDEKLDGLRIYKLKRTMKESVLNFGLTMQGEGVAQRDRMFMQLFARNPGKDKHKFCGKAVYTQPLHAKVMPLISQAGFSLMDDKRCRTERELFLLVYHPVKSQLKSGTPYELDIWEQPLQTNPDDNPGIRLDSHWTEMEEGEPTKQVEGSETMGESSVIDKAGTYRVDVTPGQVTWVGVKAQHALVTQAVAQLAEGAEVEDGTAIEMRMTSPIGGIMNSPSIDKMPASSQATTADNQAKVAVTSGMISPSNRGDRLQEGVSYKMSSYEWNIALSAVPGVYYLALYVDGDGDPVPFDVTTKQIKSVWSDIQDKPKWNGPWQEFTAPTGAEPTAFEASEADSGSDDAKSSESGSDEASEDDAGSSALPWIVLTVLGALGVLGALAGLLVVVLGRRKRA